MPSLTATSAALIFLGLPGAVLVYRFVREAGPRAVVGLLLALPLHAAAVLWSPGKPNLSAPTPRFEIELVAAPTPAMVPPPPLPEPTEVEPTAPASDRRAHPKRQRRRRPATQTSPKPTTAGTPQPGTAAPRRFDLGRHRQGSTSGIQVVPGSGGSASGTPGQGAGPRSPARAGPQPSEAIPKPKRTWAPASALHVHTLPRPVRVPKRTCSATRHGVEGTVSLDVQVRRDGTVRRAVVHEGIGSPCDQVAIAALEAARFKPAVDHRGHSVDFELRYEYAFRLSR